MAHAQSPVVVGLGEVLWDCFPDSRQPGGAPANVAYHADQLGCRGVVCSAIGADELGEEFVRFLHSQGMPTEYLQWDEAHPTGRATVNEAVPGHPEFVIHEGVAWDHLKWNDRLQELMQSAAAVCFGTLAQREPATRATVYRCLEACRPECLCVYDLNLRQDYYRREWIERSLGLARIVKLNAQEATVLGAMLEIGQPDTDDADMLAAFAARLCEDYDLQLACVTRAERGCVTVSGEERCIVGGRPVDVVDSVGAGDAFTAALLTGLLAGAPLQQSTEFAAAVGALVASRAGAMPPIRDEAANIRRELGLPAGET